ncbi:solute carrier family 35 member E1 homolog [Mercenaria mercenaria]|uniref:solute carrier family 35 member E1 homolog n=1 Tax=Mercenaria mercenaria TaxID=6596 RepID=UPI00234F7672|nr:solute carrier family 35 member E1 homolog [Mercenaria mercenaria]
MTDHDFLHVLKLIIVCVMWYISSAGGNVIGKLVLNEFPYPMTMSMVQLLSAALYLGPILSLLGVPKTGEISRRYFLTMIIPLAFGKFVSSVSSHISIWKVSVSYAHTVKATLPLFTVILMRLCFKEKQTFPVYLSLVPIIGGVCIATVTEIAFDVVGLCSALFATLGFSLQTIFSKKTLKDTGLHHMNLLLILSRYSTVCFLPFWLMFDVTRIVQDRAVLEHDNKLFAVGLILLDGVFNMLQNLFAFTVLAMVNPLSYAVANATKRVVIIGASLALLHNPVTAMNVVGMLIAVFGVLLYNWAKYYQRLAAERERVLPYIHSDSDLTNFVHKHETLVHSVTEMNLQKNGFVHDNFLFENVNNNYHTPKRNQVNKLEKGPNSDAPD